VIATSRSRPWVGGSTSTALGPTATRPWSTCWWSGKARTEAELLVIVRESERGLPAIRVWTREGLEGVARRLS
jgi:hypothetical protein